MPKLPPKMISCDRIVEINLSTGHSLPASIHLNMWKIRYELEEGKQGFYRFASRKKHLKSCQDGFDNTPDAVVIAALVKHNGIYKVVITHEFRLPLNDYEYGLPTGLIDKGETVEQAAVRELNEETGLTITKFLCVSPPLATSPGLTDEMISMVVVEAEGEINIERQEAFENISVNLIDSYEIKQLISRKDKYENAIISARLWPLFIGLGEWMVRLNDG